MCCIFTAIYDPENNAHDMFGVQSVKKNLSLIESNTDVQLEDEAGIFFQYDLPV